MYGFDTEFFSDKNMKEREVDRCRMSLEQSKKDEDWYKGILDICDQLSNLKNANVIADNINEIRKLATAGTQRSHADVNSYQKELDALTM